MKIFCANSPKSSPERGQAFLVIVVFVAVFLLVILGIAADYTQVWAHRQMAQGAADAACQAGAADLYLKAIDSNASGSNGIGNFSWIGADFDCSTNATVPPCAYAALNGYSGSNVHVSFPAALPGVSALPGSFGTVANPYIQVTITDPVGMSFTKLVSAGTVSMTAKAGCGLNPVSVPVPLVVLHQGAAGSLSVTGTGSISIKGGPTRSVQVDSSSTGAVSVGTVDLHLAGPNNTGADFGVFGGPSTKPGGVNLGTSGNWVQPAAPFGDPWATVKAPDKPPSAGTATPVPFTINGCPDPAGCVELTPGDYSACNAGTISPGGNGCLQFPYGGSVSKFNAFGTDWVPGPYAAGTLISPTAHNAGNYTYKVTGAGTSCGLAAEPNPWNQTIGGNTTDCGVTWINMGPTSKTPGTAIFDPGLYYVGATGFGIKQATVRTSTAIGDGNRGIMFYFTGGGTVTVTANAGKSPACTAASPGSTTPNSCIVSYNIDGSTSSVATGSVPMRALQCPGGDPNPVTGTLDGDILLGPCSGTYGSTDGTSRGFLFFQAHTNSATPNWGGGGQFLLSGFMYFHSSASATKVTCGTDTTCLNMDGGSGSGSYTLGNLVADQVKMTGNSGITMILNPKVSFQVLRPTLLE
jgi:hypothetical protein